MVPSLGPRILEAVSIRSLIGQPSASIAGPTTRNNSRGEISSTLPRLSDSIDLAMADSVTKDRNENVASTKIVQDHDIISSSKEELDSVERAHMVGFNDDELILEKKLRVKIDLMIMPLMVWTYLMNYIDRWVNMSSVFHRLSNTFQKQLRCRSTSGP